MLPSCGDDETWTLHCTMHIYSVLSKGTDSHMPIHSQLIRYNVNPKYMTCSINSKHKCIPYTLEQVHYCHTHSFTYTESTNKTASAQQQRKTVSCHPNTLVKTIRRQRTRKWLAINQGESTNAGAGRCWRYTLHSIRRPWLWVWAAQSAFNRMCSQPVPISPEAPTWILDWMREKCW